MENNYEIVDDAVLPEDLVSQLHNQIKQTVPVKTDSNKQKPIQKFSSIRNNNEYNINDSSKISKSNSITKSAQRRQNQMKSKEITEDIMSLLSSIHSIDEKKTKNLSKKVNSKDSSINTSRNSVGTNISFGERLYRKSLALKETKERKVKQYKEENESKFKKECLFKPQLTKQTYSINFKSKYETENYLSDFSYVKHRTIDLTDSKRREIESYQKKKEEEELKELRPTIKKPAKEIEEFSNKLFQEAEKLKQIKQEETDNFYKTTYSFSPKISDLSEPKVDNFFRRLQSWIDKRNENFIKEKELAVIDSKTGQPFFKPTIHYTKTTENLQRNVFIDLFEEKEKLVENKKEKEMQNKENFENLTKTKKVSQLSVQINEKNKKECFDYFFDLLKDSEENVIKYNSVLEKKIETNFKPEIKIILEPVMAELKEDKYFLNKEEFILVLEQLYLLLNVDEKRRLIDFYVKSDERNLRKKKFTQNKENFMTFQPKIREKSHRLFDKCDRYAKDLILRNKEFLKNRENFFEVEQKNKVAKEIEACTFRPKIDPKVKGAYRIDKYQL